MLSQNSLTKQDNPSTQPVHPELDKLFQAIIAGNRFDELSQSCDYSVIHPHYQASVVDIAVAYGQFFLMLKLLKQPNVTLINQSNESHHMHFLNYVCQCKDLKTRQLIITWVLKDAKITSELYDKAGISKAHLLSAIGLFDPSNKDLFSDDTCRAGLNARHYYYLSGYQYIHQNNNAQTKPANMQGYEYINDAEMKNQLPQLKRITSGLYAGKLFKHVLADLMITNPDPIIHYFEATVGFVNLNQTCSSIHPHAGMNLAYALAQTNDEVSHQRLEKLYEAYPQVICLNNHSHNKTSKYYYVNLASQLIQNKQDTFLLSVLSKSGEKIDLDTCVPQSSNPIHSKRLKLQLLENNPTLLEKLIKDTSQNINLYSDAYNFDLPTRNMLKNEFEGVPFVFMFCKEQNITVVREYCKLAYYDEKGYFIHLDRQVKNQTSSFYGHTLASWLIKHNQKESLDLILNSFPRQTVDLSIKIDNQTLEDVLTQNLKLLELLKKREEAKKIREELRNKQPVEVEAQEVNQVDNKALYDLFSAVEEGDQDRVDALIQENTYDMAVRNPKRENISLTEFATLYGHFGLLLHLVEDHKAPIEPQADLIHLLSLVASNCHYEKLLAWMFKEQIYLQLGPAGVTVDHFLAACGFYATDGDEVNLINKKDKLGFSPLHYYLMVGFLHTEQIRNTIIDTTKYPNIKAINPEIVDKHYDALRVITSGKFKDVSFSLLLGILSGTTSKPLINFVECFSKRPNFSINLSEPFPFTLMLNGSFAYGLTVSNLDEHRAYLEKLYAKYPQYLDLNNEPNAELSSGGSLAFHLLSNNLIDLFHKILKNHPQAINFENSYRTTGTKLKLFMLLNRQEEFNKLIKSGQNVNFMTDGVCFHQYTRESDKRRHAINVGNPFLFVLFLNDKQFKTTKLYCEAAKQYKHGHWIDLNVKSTNITNYKTYDYTAAYLLAENKQWDIFELILDTFSQSIHLQVKPEGKSASLEDLLEQNKLLYAKVLRLQAKDNQSKIPKKIQSHDNNDDKHSLEIAHCILVDELAASKKKPADPKITSEQQKKEAKEKNEAKKNKEKYEMKLQQLEKEKKEEEKEKQKKLALKAAENAKMAQQNTVQPIAEEDATAAQQPSEIITQNLRSWVKINKFTSRKDILDNNDTTDLIQKALMDKNFGPVNIALFLMKLAKNCITWDDAESIGMSEFLYKVKDRFFEQADQRAILDLAWALYLMDCDSVWLEESTFRPILASKLSEIVKTLKDKDNESRIIARKTLYTYYGLSLDLPAEDIVKIDNILESENAPASSYTHLLFSQRIASLLRDQNVITIKNEQCFRHLAFGDIFLQDRADPEEKKYIIEVDGAESHADKKAENAARDRTLTRCFGITTIIRITVDQVNEYQSKTDQALITFLTEKEEDKSKKILPKTMFKSLPKVSESSQSFMGSKKGKKNKHAKPSLAPQNKM